VLTTGGGLYQNPGHGNSSGPPLPPGGGAAAQPFEGGRVPRRQHGTGGFEVRLFRLNLFGERHVSLSYAFDGARRYMNNFVSVGIWSY
jgi:hypothetical protein